MDYRTFRLKNKSQRYNPKIASKVGKLVKKLGSPLKVTDLEKIDPISILAFLKEFLDAYDGINIHIRVAMCLVSYFMKKVLPSSSLKARL